MLPSSTRCLALCAALTLVAGCASYEARPFIDSGAASSYLQHHEREGLHVAVLDHSGERNAVKHFDRELPEYRYIPVQLLVELDAASNASFDLRREELSLVIGDGTRLGAADPLDVIDEVSFSHWRTFWSFLLLLPGPFVASSVSSANEELESDYLAKSLRSVRVSPNMRSYRGVVFFELPSDWDGELSMADAFVEIEVSKQGSGEGDIGQRLEFPVHFSN